MRKEEGSILVVAMLASLALMATAAAVTVLGNLASRTAETRATATQARYAAETVLARSIHDLGTGGSGAIGPVEAHGFTVTAVVADSLVTARAGGRGQSVELEAAVVPYTVTVPMPGAAYIDSYSELDLSGNALTITGGDEFGIATGDDASLLIAQLDPGSWDQITGLETAPSVGEVEPINVRALAETMSQFGTFSPDDVHLSGSGSGSGVLVVDGDLQVSGSYQFTGLVVVTGAVQLLGGGDSLTVNGSLVVGGDLKVAGNVAVQFDSGVLTQLQADIDAQTPAVRLTGVRLVR